LPIYLASAPFDAQFATPGLAARVADARNEVDLLDETARVVLRHHHVLASEERHVLGLQHRADEPHLGIAVVADAHAVDVAVLVDLRPAGETEIDVAPLDGPVVVGETARLRLA